MRAAATIFLLVLLLSAQTPLGQLLKFPALIEHFYKHQKKEGISLLQFLNDHYATDHNDADRSEDQQLPFKTILLQTVGLVIMPRLEKTDFALAPIVLQKATVRGVYRPQQHLCSIFHPPQL